MWFQRTLIKLSLASCFVLGAAAQAADHADAPLLIGLGQLDINDIYAFQSPTNSRNTVLIMTVNPMAGVMSPTSFSSSGIYQLHVDNDGDAKADVTFSILFSREFRGRQLFLAFRGFWPIGIGLTGTNARLFGGGLLRADLFDDPFFFDLAGFRNGFEFTGDDFFAGLNVSAIVMEIPSQTLGGPVIGVWATTLSRGRQIDRMGRPAINTVLIPSARKDEFNVSQPAQDFIAFGDDVEETILALNGGDTDAAEARTRFLLPDVLTFNTGNAMGFLNGRQLADDVIDAELNLLTNGAVTTDRVDFNNDNAEFPGRFPHLAKPNQLDTQ